MKNWRRLDMRSEWTKKKLSDIADFNPRETIKKGAVAKKISMDVLRPFYRDVPYYTEECFSGGTKFRNGDTIMARITPCLENGKTAHVSILNDGEVGFGSTEYIVFRAKEGIANKDYLYYLVCSPEVREPAIKSMVGSSGRQRVQTDVVKNLEIDVPPLVDQEKIGSFLKSFDDKIALNDKINKNLLQQLDTLYDEFSHRENWSTVTINDIAEKVAMGPFGSNIKVSTFVSEGIPIISGNHLRGYFLEEPSFNYITEEHAQRLKNSLVYPKDIVFTHAGNIGQVAMIPDDCRYPMYVLSQRQFYLRCDTEKAIPEYVVLFFHSKQGQHELLSYANQTGVPSIAQPATNLKKILLKLPPIDEQRQWLQLVSPVIKLYQSNVYENEHLSSMRDSLLPKLMSGELDVSDIDL